MIFGGRLKQVKKSAVFERQRRRVKLDWSDTEAVCERRLAVNDRVCGRVFDSSHDENLPNCIEEMQGDMLWANQDLKRENSG